MLSLLTTVWQVQKAPYPTILEWTHVFTTMVFIIYCISKHVAPAVHLVYYIKQRQRNPTGQYRMHNPKKLATLGTQDRRGNTEYTTQKHWQHWVHKTDGAIQNAQPRDTGNIGYTRPTGQYRMYNPETLATLGTQDRRGNTECTTQRHCQYWVHKTQEEDNQNTNQNTEN
jgi:hypothetical protein